MINTKEDLKFILKHIATNSPLTEDEGFLLLKNSFNIYRDLEIIIKLSLTGVHIDRIKHFLNLMR